MSEELDLQHRELVRDLTKTASQIEQEMATPQYHLVHMVMGIAGEAGELLDAIKKNAIYHKPLDLTNVIEELGDLEFYMQGLRDALGISRERVLEGNISKLRKRYGQNYSNQAAIARADK